MKILRLSVIAYLYTGFLSPHVYSGEPATTEPQISLELLEYLGSFSTVDGKWIDPMEVTTMLEETPVSIEKQVEKSE